MRLRTLLLVLVLAIPACGPAFAPVLLWAGGGRRELAAVTQVVEDRDENQVAAGLRARLRAGR